MSDVKFLGRPQYRSRKLQDKEQNVSTQQESKKRLTDPDLQYELNQPAILEPKTIIERSTSNLPIKPDSMEDYKKKCADLGFKAGTERFGKCVLRLSN